MIPFRFRISPAVPSGPRFLWRIVFFSEQYKDPKLFQDSTGPHEMHCEFAARFPPVPFLIPSVLFLLRLERFCCYS